MNHLYVYKDKDSWFIKSDNKEIKKIFGTDTLPTAYTSSLDAKTVYKELSFLNPSSEIYMRGEDVYGGTR